MISYRHHIVGHYEGFSGAMPGGTAAASAPSIRQIR